MLRSPVLRVEETEGGGSRPVECVANSVKKRPHRDIGSERPSGSNRPVGDGGQGSCRILDHGHSGGSQNNGQEPDGINQRRTTDAIDGSADTEVEMKTWSNVPPHEYDFRNPGTIRVGFETVIPANRASQLKVRLIPLK